MTRILLVTHKSSNSISFYRSVMPWNQIQKEYDDVFVTTIDLSRPTDVFQWDVLSAHDILFISNPIAAKHLDIIRVAKTYGLKTWSDYDDCYLDIPEDDKSFNLVSRGHIGQVVKDCLIESDITTVTTEYLKSMLLPYSTRIEVVKNAFPMDLLNENSLSGITQGTHNFVSWRGSEHHARSMKEFSKEITAVAKENPDWTFKFFGYNPDFDFDYTHHEFTELFDSFYRLKKFSSKIHIVTLFDRPFNRSKSNISFIEGVIAGSVVLAPDWQEWKLPGVVNYSTKEDFQEKLSCLLKGEYNLTELFEESRDYILNNLSLKEANKDRIKILQNLTGCKVRL